MAADRTTPGTRYRVHVEPMLLHLGIGYATHRWYVVDAAQSLEHSGIATSRAAAWKLALATLRGMIRLARVRKIGGLDAPR